MIIAFHNCSTIARIKCALFLPHFVFFSTDSLIELCQSFSSIFNILCRFALNTSFFIQNMLTTRGGLILDTNRSNSCIYIAFGAVVAVQLFVSSSFLACFLGTPTSCRLKIAFCATYHANNNWSDCFRIANVCRIRKYAGNPSQSK